MPKAVYSGVGSALVKSAVDAMVWHAMDRADAAKHAGMQDESLRLALKRPHVLDYYREQMKVLRTSAQSKAMNTIIELMNTSGSDKVRLEASLRLLEDGEKAHTEGVSIRHAGVTIVIEAAKDVVGRVVGRPQVIDVKANDISDIDDELGGE